jgi:hypothetical protein
MGQKTDADGIFTWCHEDHRLTKISVCILEKQLLFVNKRKLSFVQDFSFQIKTNSL